MFDVGRSMFNTRKAGLCGARLCFDLSGDSSQATGSVPAAAKETKSTQCAKKSGGGLRDDWGQLITYSTGQYRGADPDAICYGIGIERESAQGRISSVCVSA